MTTDGELQYDREVVGVEVEVGRFEVSRDQILAFCEAVGETNPLYTDEQVAAAGPWGGLVAPPAFYSTARVGQGPDPKVRFGNHTLNAGQRIELFEPIRPGDVITARARVKDVFEKTGRSGRMVFVVRQTTYSNQKGETVAVVESSMVSRQVGE